MIDYLAIGHVTEDVWRDGSRTAGGGVMYSSRTARRLTQNVAIFTTSALTFDTTGTFPDIRVQRLISSKTTEFENIYSSAGRIQITRPSPTVLEPQDCFFLREAEIVHLAPVCNETSSAFAGAVRRDVFLGLTPQGWLRRWDASGRVTQNPSYWTDAGKLLARANCVVTSIEDINGDWQVAHKWAAQTRLLIVTCMAACVPCQRTNTISNCMRANIFPKCQRSQTSGWGCERGITPPALPDCRHRRGFSSRNRGGLGWL